MIEELIYDEAAMKLIKAEYPTAEFKDESDYIHEGRFSVIIQDITEEEFYMFALRKGFARACFKFELMLLDKNNGTQKIETWLSKIEAIKNDTNRNKSS
jgi:hypothetical protein